ncbi:MAG: type III restriction-modification enzyme, R/helicase subunit, type III restriction enzyme, partial [Chloroflexi bacterium CSP1-4]
MTRVVIENPILNSPFREPEQHFRFSDEGITQDVAEGRRRSTYFVPIPPPKKKTAGQLVLGAEFARERAQDNDFINRVREQVNAASTTRYPSVTAVTRELLRYWT